MAPARTPLPFFFFFVFFTLNLSLSLNLAASASKTKPRTPAPAPLSEAVVAELAQALQAAAGRGGPTNTYLAASLLLPHYLRPLTRSRITLLLPTDAVLFLHPSSSSSSSSTSTSSSAMPLLSAMPPSQLRSLARFHMLTTNLTFANLLTLPKATLLPTLLGDAYRLRIDTTTAAAAASSAAANFLIEGAHIIHPDICPPSLSHIVTCHGIDRLLLASSSSSSSSSSAPTTPTTPTSPSSSSSSAAVAPASAPLASGDVVETASPDSSAAPASLPTTILRSYSNPSTSHRIIDAYVVVNGSYTVASAPPPPPPASKSGVRTSTSLPSAAADAIGSSIAAFSPAPAPLTASSSASAAKSPLALSQLLLLTLAGLVAVAAAQRAA